MEEVWVWRGSRFWVLLAGRLGVRYHSGYYSFGLGLVGWGDFVAFFVWHVQMHIRFYHSCSRITVHRFEKEGTRTCSFPLIASDLVSTTSHDDVPIGWLASLALTPAFALVDESPQRPTVCLVA
jgi:hypothetical protein